MNPTLQQILAPTPPWRHFMVGGGALTTHGITHRLAVPAAPATRYCDAQIDDYRANAQPHLLHQPPLRLTIRARFSHAAGELRGTAGFGLWNYPFVPSVRQLPRLPKAVWFFYASPPSNLKLDADTPGHGWKAATVDTQRPAAFALLPAAPLVILAMQFPRLYQRLWPRLQRAVGVREALLSASMMDWHTYEIDWGTSHSAFRVDGHTVLDHAPSPRGPLCFVLWVDNQSMVVTPQARFGWGLLNITQPQWLEFDTLEITRLP